MLLIRYVVIMNRNKITIKEYKQLTQPSEYDECVLLVNHLNELKDKGKVTMYTHIPNETYTSSWNQKRKNKMMGVSSGFPDYLILTRTMLIVIEMKREKGGITSPEQKAWLKAFCDLGMPSQVCHGFEEAKKFLSKLI